MDRHDDFLARALTSPALARNDFGDGFLVVLSSVTDAVNSALRFLAVLRDDEVTASLGVRIGIHLGDLGGMNEHTTGTPRLTGLHVDITARVMGIAGRGQILLSQTAMESAKPYVQYHPPAIGIKSLDVGAHLNWLEHGRYAFKGVASPITVWEVGVCGEAPFSHPAESDKARLLGIAELPTGIGTIGPYEVREEIGRGNYGEVYRARHTQLGRDSALKLIRLTTPESIAQFEKEGRILVGLDHPRIVRVYDAGFAEIEGQGFGYLALDRIEGTQLDRYLLEPSLSISQIALLLADVSGAVAYAHGRGVIHGDLNATNVLVTADGKAHLVDFGIARLGGVSSSRDAAIGDLNDLRELAEHALDSCSDQSSAEMDDLRSRIRVARNSEKMADVFASFESGVDAAPVGRYRRPTRIAAAVGGVVGAVILLASWHSTPASNPQSGAQPTTTADVQPPENASTVEAFTPDEFKRLIPLLQIEAIDIPGDATKILIHGPLLNETDRKDIVARLGSNASNVVDELQVDPQGVRRELERLLGEAGVEGITIVVRQRPNWGRRYLDIRVPPSETDRVRKTALSMVLKADDIRVTELMD